MVQWKNVGLSETRPAIRARHHIVSSGHYLASMAGQRMFDNGGNAIDAGVAAGLALNVLLPEWTSIGGVAPILVRDGSSGTISSVVGLGRWPATTDVSVFRETHGSRIPSGPLRWVTPAAMGAWLTALDRFGRLRLEDVIEPALELAEHGIPVHEELHRHLAQFRDRLLEWPGTAATFYPRRETPAAGSRLRQMELAQTLWRLIDAARPHDGRSAGIAAAYELFYRGAIAMQIAEYSEQVGGWLRYEDLARVEIDVEEPVSAQYRGIDVFTGDSWCQGPVVLQTLNLLSLQDIASLRHNSPEYIHLLVEALRLAFADRDAFYGDPGSLPVPIHGLVSMEYAKAQRTRIDPRRSAVGLPAPGDPWRFEELEPGVRAASPLPRSLDPGTACVCAVDSDGNAFSAAPSDGIQSSPVVPGLGFAVSSRGVQSWVEDGHPTSIRAGERPFLTPTPQLATREGEFLLAYATPGMDTQPQALVQFIANVVDFGMDLQQAVEAPRFVTRAFPVAMDPHEWMPNSVYLEGRIDGAVTGALTALGHDVHAWPDFTSEAGSLTAVMADPRTDALIGGADPRRLCYAIGW